MVRILVTGAGGPAGINVIRALKKEDYYIISTDISEYSEGFLFSDKYYLIVPAKDHSFITQLDDIIENENIDLVIPTVDEELIALTNNRLKFESKIILHPKKTIEMCLDKYKLYKYFSKRVPELIPEFSLDPTDLKSKKIVKKPRVGRGSRGVVVGDKDQFVKEDRVFYVEYLPGEEWTVDTLTDRDGDLIIAVPRIRIKTRGGISVIGKVIINERIINYVRNIVSELKFTGPLNIQFKEDRNGNLRLQEINPRFSGGLDITIAAGANLPTLLVKIFLGEYSKEDIKLKIKEGLYYRIWDTFC